MGLRDIMFMTVEPEVAVRTQEHRIAEMVKSGCHPLAIELLVARSRLREDRKALDILFEKRSWELVDGVVRGRWVMCANNHDAFSETPKEDGWRTENLLGRPFWLCDAKCVSEWRTKMAAKMDLFSRNVPITWPDGKKTTMVTTGKTLSGRTTSLTY